MSAPTAFPARYAVVGHPVAHSQSPFIHAAFAAQTGEAIDYERLLCPLDAFAPTLRAFAASGASGCNVTMPFKFVAAGLVARTTARATLAAAVAEGGLDQEVHVTAPDGRHASLRRLVFDLVEEYGRHTGHADLLREAVDGLVGEDPPEDWRP